MNLFARFAAAIAFSTLVVGCSANQPEGSINTKNSASIIGGTEVSEGSEVHQSIVAIYDRERGALCTGSLLENNIILTAAHCIGAKAEDHLIVFTTNLHELFKNQDREFVQSRIRKSVKVVVHPNWGKVPEDINQGAWGDVALIKFEGEVPAGFVPAKILVPTRLTEGTKIVIAGYGVSSDILSEINPTEHPDFEEKVKTGEFFCDIPENGNTEKCYREEKSGEGLLRTTEVTFAMAFNDTEVVFDQQHGQAACEGDSGGPAYLRVGNELHLFGVTSRGSRGCNGFVVYSDVTTESLAIWLTDAKKQISEELAR